MQKHTCASTKIHMYAYAPHFYYLCGMEHWVRCRESTERLGGSRRMRFPYYYTEDYLLELFLLWTCVCFIFRRKIKDTFIWEKREYDILLFLRKIIIFKKINYNSCVCYFPKYGALLIFVSHIVSSHEQLLINVGSTEWQVTFIRKSWE